LHRSNRRAVRAIGDAMSWLERIIEAIAAWIRRCIPAYEPAI
jgi:hypothetical protein